MIESMPLAPICLFVYRRIDSLTYTVESLLRCPESKNTILYVFSDGPCSEFDLPLVEKVREYISKIAGFKSVNLIINEDNRGLASSIISGVSQIVNRYGNVIVLEDDLELSPSFLHFMNLGLNCYKSNAEVISICGFSNVDPDSMGEGNCYFSRRSSSWGWATWADRWNSIDFERYSRSGERPNINFLLRLVLNSPDLPKMLLAQQKGKIDSWAVRFVAHQIDNKLFSLHPKYSLVKNRGFGLLATNTDYSYGLQKHVDFISEDIVFLSEARLAFSTSVKIWLSSLFGMCVRFFMRRWN